jgi:hypothetical protein
MMDSTAADFLIETGHMARPPTTYNNINYKCIVSCGPAFYNPYDIILTGDLFYNTVYLVIQSI